MPLSLEDINRLFKIDSKENEELPETSHQEYGPGQFDVYRSVVGGQPSFKKNKANTTTSRKKFIFCSPLMQPWNTPDLSPVSISFFTGLMKHYDVYLWPGENVPFSHCKRIKDIHEFWKKFREASPATETAVKQSLGQQGLALDDYRILDRRIIVMHTCALLHETSAEEINRLQATIAIPFVYDPDNEKAKENIIKSYNCEKILFINTEAVTRKETDFFC